MKSFSDYGITLNHGARGETKTQCPQCSPHRKKSGYPCLNVNVDDGVWHCWHCEWSGGLKQGVWKPAQIKTVYKKPAPITQPKITENWRKWLNGRGISDNTIGHNGLYNESVWFPQINAEADAVCFPFMIGGEVFNVKYRDLQKNFRLFGGAERVLYGLDHIKAGAPMIWVEGELDKLSLFEAGFENCVSVPDGAPAANTKNYSSKFDYLESAKKTIESASCHIIAVDNDEPGQKLKTELVRRLGAENCLIVEWPDGCKDANDTLLKHGKEILKEAIDSAKLSPVEGVFYVGDVYNDLVELYCNGAEGGLKCGFSNLDELYSVRAGEFTVITGIPSHGKSVFLDAMLIRLAKNSGLRTAYCSPENQPIELHLKNLAQKWIAKPFFKDSAGYERMTTGELTDACAGLQEYFSFILPEVMTLDCILARARSEVFRRGIGALVIDPWNELEHSRPTGQSETEYIGESLRKMRIFARANKIHLFIVGHPTKMRKDENGKEMVPSPYDICGSANWRNKADNCLAVYRNPDSVDVYVQKIRFQEVGRVGMATFKFISALADYREAGK